MAWLNVVPKDEKLSRLEQLEASNMWAEMPEADGLYIVGYLQELGFDNTTNREILSWCELSGIELQAWEAEFIRKLSRDYMVQYHNKEADEPYKVEEISDQNAKAVSDNVRKSLDSWLLLGS